MAAAVGLSVPDLVRPGLRVLFCGINPSLYSGATGFHFATPGNRFWPTLHQAGFTPRLLHPSETAVMLELGLGITNLVNRATASAADLDSGELIAGAAPLVAKVEALRPRVIAVVGIGAYRMAFADPKAAVGLQERRIGSSAVWALPNPSGLNAHYQQPALTALFAEVKVAVGTP